MTAPEESLDLYSVGLIERTMAEPPDWGTINTLDQMLCDEELAALGDAAAYLVRSGPECAFEDLPEGVWPRLAVLLSDWDDAEQLRMAERWDALDHWLVSRESAMIEALHALYCSRIRSALARRP